MVKKYIIMCGGDYKTYWDKPRQLSKVYNEILIERTIRLLKENGICDISISATCSDFDYLGVPILKHHNSYRTEGKQVLGYWCDAFYLTNEPVCYIFGDVYFSDEAIKKIVETETNDIEFFASMPPFADNYPKNHVEPFALKVMNTKHLKQAIQKTKQYEDENKFWRKPLMWELWTVIKNVPLQKGPNDFIYNYVAINDYTSDIDREKDIRILEWKAREIKMIKLEAIRKFSLKDFDKIEIVSRADQDVKGILYQGDVFLCQKPIAEYLLGDNKYKEAFVKVLEVIPEETPKKTTRRKTSKK